MKTLLICPPVTIYGAIPALPAIFQPLGVSYVAAYAEKLGHEVSVLDARGRTGSRVTKLGDNATLYGMTDAEVAAELERIAPDAVGISTMWTAYSADSHRLAKLVKEYDPSVPVIFGGAHASEFPQLAIRDSNVDFVVVGEGEITFTELLSRLENGQATDNVPGLAYMRDGEMMRTPPRPRITDLDSLPMPAFHLLDMDLYKRESRNNKYLMRHPAACITTSRGCPQRCVYCTIHSVWGRKWTSRSPANVVDEMEHLHKAYGMREIAWLDDSAGVDKRRLDAICDEIIRRKLDIRWTTPNGIAHWTLDEDLIRKMRKAGCYRVTFGIESGNVETREFIRKTFSLDQAKQMIRAANRAGMWTICTFILGFPYETREAVEDTIRFAVECDTDMAVFYLLMPHPSSDVYQTFKDEGLLNFDHVLDPSAKHTDEDFARLGEMLSMWGNYTTQFSKDELQDLLSQAYRTFFRSRIKSFLNPLRVARKIRSWEEMRYAYTVGRQFMAPIRKFLTSKYANINMIWDKNYEKRFESKSR